MKSYCWATAFMVLLCAQVARAENCASPTPGSLANPTQCKIEDSSSPILGSQKSMKGWHVVKWRSPQGKYFYALLSGTNREVTDSDLESSKLKSFSELKYKLKQLSEGQEVMSVSPQGGVAPKLNAGKIVYFSRVEIRELGSLLKQKKIQFSNQ